MQHQPCNIFLFMKDIFFNVNKNLLTTNQGFNITGMSLHLTCKYSGSTPYSPVWVCSHSIRMLRSPNQANMGHSPNTYMNNLNIYLDFHVFSVDKNIYGTHITRIGKRCSWKK